MTVPNLAEDDTITETWVDAVADQLNTNLPPKITYGATTGTTDGTGNLSITHGLGATPTVCLAQPASTNWTQGYVSSIGATTFNVRCFNAAGSALATTSVTVHWVSM